MAVRTFDGVDDLLVLGGTGTAICNGAYSIVVIAKPTTFGSDEAYIGLQVGTSSLLGSLADGGGTGRLAVNTDGPFAVAEVGVTAGDWQIFAMSHASAGAATFSRKVLGSGSWTHSAGATIANQTGTCNRIEIGGYLNGGFGSVKDARIAVVAVFPTALSQANVESIQTTPSTQQLVTLGAVAVWDLNQASTATSVVDLVGSANQTALTGTTVTGGDDPTGWTFGLGGGDATVTAVPADATGDITTPTISAGATATSPAADATGDIQTPAVSADFTATAPAIDGTGDIATPAVTADATVTAPPLDATGDIPSADMSLGVEIVSGPVSATGSIPAPTVTGSGGDATTTAPAADSTGDIPAPTVSAGAGVTSPAGAAAGDVPAPAAAAGATITSPTADATAAIPVPTVTAASAGEVLAAAADATGTVPAPAVAADAAVTAPPAAAAGALAAPTASGSGSGTVSAVPLDATGALPVPAGAGYIPIVFPTVPAGHIERAEAGHVEREAALVA